MAIPSPQYILSCGFGRFGSGNPNAEARFGPNAGEKIKELLAATHTEARAAGFEIVSCDINPADPEDSFRRYAEALQEREWAAVNVGFGVRGHKENTAIFEKMLNHARETSPGTKVIFSNGPDEIVPAIKRNFPEAFT